MYLALFLLPRAPGTRLCYFNFTQLFGGSVATAEFTHPFRGGVAPCVWLRQQFKSSCLLQHDPAAVHYEQQGWRSNSTTASSFYPWMTITWKPVRKVPVYTKLYVHISTDTLVDSRPFPLTTLYRFSTKLASPSWGSELLSPTASTAYSYSSSQPPTEWPPPRPPPLQMNWKKSRKRMKGRRLKGKKMPTGKGHPGKLRYK